MSERTITGRDPQSGRCIALLVEEGVIARAEEFPEDSDLYLSAGLVDCR
jgi:hypothetical protein